MPSRFKAITEHSICQPGRPGPSAVSQDGSPGRLPRHSSESSGSRLPARSGSPPRSANSREHGVAVVSGDIAEAVGRTSPRSMMSWIRPIGRTRLEQRPDGYRSSGTGEVPLVALVETQVAEESLPAAFPDSRCRRHPSIGGVELAMSLGSNSGESIFTPILKSQWRPLIRSKVFCVEKPASEVRHNRSSRSLSGRCI